MSAKTNPTKADHLKRKEIALIQMGRTFLAETLDWNDAKYRATLAELCDGKTSSTKLTWQERHKVIEHMKSLGFVVKKTASSGRAWDDGMFKLRAIWYSLAEVGAVQRPDSSELLDAAIETWAKRMKPKLAALRFADRYEMQDLIEAAKKWATRVGAPTEADQAKQAKRD